MRGLRVLVVSALILLFGLTLWRLREVLTPLFFAFLIAYMLDPLADRMEDRGLPRAAAIVVLLTSFTLIFGGFLLLVLPGVVQEIGAFLTELPGATRRLLEEWEPVLESVGLEVPHSLSELMERFASEGAPQEAFAPAAAAAGYILGGTASFAASLVNALMIPVFAFYLLYDFDRMTAAITALVPPRFRGSFVGLARDVDEVLGQFIRGQLLVMLILAVLYSVGYSLVGVRLAIPIGIAAGLLAFIPYVGGALALVLAVGMVLFDGQGMSALVQVVIVYGAIQLLEGFVVTPAVVGDKVGLSALWVLIALLAFGELFGFLGVLLAVPAAAVLKIFLGRGVQMYRASEFFGEEDETEEERATLVDEAVPDAHEPAGERESDETASDEARSNETSAPESESNAGDSEPDGVDAPKADEPNAEDAPEVEAAAGEAPQNDATESVPASAETTTGADADAANEDAKKPLGGHGGDTKDGAEGDEQD
ncbi:MAG: AI-2E family transporter [Myxococcota bacterium]